MRLAGNDTGKARRLSMELELKRPFVQTNDVQETLHLRPPAAGFLHGLVVSTAAQLGGG
jgi:hypothetical protein